MAAFVHRERVRFGDLDAMRHVNNAVFLRYFETARISYLGGLQVHNPVAEVETGFGLIFAECQISYRSPVNFDESLDIALTVTDVRRSSFRLNFEMRVGERLCAEGHGVMVGFDYAEGRATGLPEEMRTRLEAEAAKAPATSA
jgi:acyl-CoA thioester hydrolase